MKSASPALVSYLNAVRGYVDGQLVQADAFLFLTRLGAQYAYTNSDVTFAFGGITYLGNNILISGLKYRATIGLDVDQQDITVAARADHTVGGVPFLQALREGVFDGAEITRTRFFWTDYVGGNAVDTTGVIMFKGRVGAIGDVGRTSAKISVNSDLVLLDIDYPRNLYQPSCLHTLYDSGCTLSASAFTTAGTVGAGATASVIPWTGANANFVQGVLTFTSGVNDGVSATVGSAIAGTSLSLIYPLPTVPAAGDTFNVAYGCDHTLATCKAKFNNSANYRAFNYVPPPQMAL